jgi:hypothetical protein
MIRRIRRFYPEPVKIARGGGVNSLPPDDQKLLKTPAKPAIGLCSHRVAG